MAPKKNNKFQRVWYCLKTPNGDPYPGTSADAVSLASGSDIAQFRDELKIKIPDTLKGIDALKLTVYKNKASLDKALEDKNKPDSKDKEEQPLDEDSPIVGLGKTKQDALMVVVPDPIIGREAKLQKLDLPEVQWNEQAGKFPRKVLLPFHIADINLPLKEFPKREEIVPVWFHTIEFKYLAASGLIPIQKVSNSTTSLQTLKEVDLVLYCRLAFHHQAAYLKKYAIDYPPFCWVVGPPGSGKSCTAFAYALSLDPLEWDVIWINYSKEYQLFRCVRFQGETKATLELDKDEGATGIQHFLSLEQPLEQPNDSKKTIVFFDGYISKDDAASKALSSCIAWHNRYKKQRRLVCVCSMVARGKDFKITGCDIIERSRDDGKVDSGHETILYLDPMNWMSWSWSLEEYLTAVQDDKFFNSVKEKLESAGDAVEPAKREDLVKAKFNVAGGNARYMFSWNTEYFIPDLQRALASASDIKVYIDLGIGHHSDQVMNRLLSVRLNGKNEMISTLLSRYVGTELAVRFGPNIVLQLKEVLSRDVNPVMDGFFLEWYILAKLSKEKTVDLTTLESNRHTTWSCRDSVNEFDPKDVNLVITKDDEYPMWLRPKSWKEPGFDALYIDRDIGLVRFVQITRAPKHSFVPKSMNTVLMNLPKDVMNVKIIEMAFVVPSENLETYTLLDTLTFNKDVVDVYNYKDGTPNQSNKALGQVKKYGMSWNKA